MQRPSFNGKYIMAELDKLSKKIINQTQVFIIGGLALINYGLKEATKDIDVVVQSRQELNALVKSLENLEYRTLGHALVSKPYKKMETTRILENKEGFRWDIFYQKISAALTFSEGMKSRATSLYKKGKLNVSIVSKEDVFLFKGITEREADLDDMRLLAESGLDWQIIKSECGYQSTVSGRLWENALLQNLADLRERYKIRSPIEKDLQRIVEERLSEDALTKAIASGYTTIKMISNATKLPENIVREYTKRMAKKGLLKVDKSSLPHKFALVHPP
jgi:hypothetical protein